MDLKIVLLTMCLHVIFSNGNYYRKFMLLNDTDYPALFKPLAAHPSKSLSSGITCAAYASSAMAQSNTSLRVSAFAYMDNVCTLGRTPVYDDQVVAKPTVNGYTANGVFAVVGAKPMTTVAMSDPPGLVAYFLFNEVSDIMQPITPGLNKLIQDNSTGPWIFPTVHNLVSPVKTLEGQFAAMGFPNLKYLHAPRTYHNMTVMLWYNPGPTIGNDGLFGTSDVTGNHYLALYTNVMNYNDTACNSSSPMARGNVNFSILPSTWSYIGFTYETGRVTLYANGSPTSNYTLKQVSCSPNGVLRDHTQIAIGRIGINTSPAMSGSIASLELYDVALNEDQVVRAMRESTTTRVLKTN